MAAVEAWRAFGSPPVYEAQGRYPMLWTFYQGDWRNNHYFSPAQKKIAPTLYANTRQILKQTDSIVSLYDQYVYAGDLSTDGKPLPDGTRGAIPVDPQVDDGGPRDKQLVAAVHQLFAMWNWRTYMSMAPKMSAILGDVLIELVDDIDSGKVYPSIVWPGFVPEIDLDSSGNVKAYVIEYDVDVAVSTAFGRVQQADHYRYRKEVNDWGIWYYKNGQPYDYGQGTFAEHPYGFAPAVWHRHEILPTTNRGMGAFEKTLLSAMETNALLSAALDYQVKQFLVPVGIIAGDAGMTGVRGRTLTLPGGVTLTTGQIVPTAEEIEEARRRAQDEQNFTPMGEGGKFVTVDFDIGKTDQILERMIESQMTENPESEFGSKLLEMAQVTGPGGARILSPIIARVEAARKNHDPQTIKLCQMAISMIAYRLKAGDYYPDVVQKRKKRYEVFDPYTIDSFSEGLLDFTIPDRPVFKDTLDEKVNRLVLIEKLSTPWAMLEAGMPEAEVTKIMAEREKQQKMFEQSAQTFNDQP